MYNFDKAYPILMLAVKYRHFPTWQQALEFVSNLFELTGEEEDMVARRWQSTQCESWEGL